MAYSDAVIFQRTDLGKAEIKNKQHGLTQSERLVLIIADGVSSYAELRAKLKSLVKERFDRALRSLSDKGLLYEVMFPLDNQLPDIVEADAMDRFLRQEDSDPVSVLSFQPEEEYGTDDLRAQGLVPLDEVEEVEVGEPVPPYPDLIENTIDRLEEPIIYTQEKVSTRIETAHTPEPEQAGQLSEVDFYLPLTLPPSEVQAQPQPVVLPVEKSVPSEPVLIKEVPVKTIVASESEPHPKPKVQAVVASKLPEQTIKKPPVVIQKFPEPKQPKPVVQVKKKTSLLDYLDSRYSLLLVLLGLLLAFMPALAKFLNK
ncbi:hypothetical protein ACO0K3_17050 [Undibacterium sp. Rencai35W]|uniref:hypothetical protein n=1 Tax=Undibacterium sp. Rencai35W TaxID=3413046 RepID=UPI003BF219FF